MGLWRSRPQLHWCQGSSSESFVIFHPGYGGRTLGDGAWADFPWFGTNKFFFIEDNTIVGNGARDNQWSYGRKFWGDDL